MAESGSSSLGIRFDMKQILLEARHRWLTPYEICEILRNYQKFQISGVSPNKPVSGSVFLFDWKVLRHFRKDGHNWRKMKDGKTKDSHQILKVGSVDMLQCYYVCGEDNNHFQRRSYWLLEQDLTHIVFVHYLDVKGNKTNIGALTNIETAVSNSEINSPLSSSFHGTSPSSTLSLAYVDAESGLSMEDNYQEISRFHSNQESPLTDVCHYDRSSSYNPLSSQAHIDGDSIGGTFICGVQETINRASSQNILQNCSADEVAYRQETGSSLSVQANCKSPTMNQDLFLNILHHENNSFEEQTLLPSQGNYLEPFYTKDQFEHKNLQRLIVNTETGNATFPDLENFIPKNGDGNYPLLLKKPFISCLQNGESLNNVDSFSRCIAKELGENGELDMHLNGMSWSTNGYEYDSGMSLQLEVDTDMLNPSIPHDQIFSIYEFSPSWAYSGLETKVLITGKFLKSEHEFSNCMWSIMFGQVEVTAEVLADGILCCRAPLNKPGCVPFYVTCANRLACSEKREFKYRLYPVQNMGSRDVPRDGAVVMHLWHRFETIFSPRHTDSHVIFAENDFEKENVLSKISSLKEEESNRQSKLTSENDISELKVIGELLLENKLKEKFFSWLMHAVTQDGNELKILDEGGQGVLHLAAALGFNWALKPIMVSGISIDFRDVYGWTALHWAACYGREDTVAALVSFGAAPGLLTDPSAKYPLGRTPADLASSSGHKGISGYLAETSLIKHLLTLEVNNPPQDGSTEVSGVKAIQTVSELSAVPTTEVDVLDTPLLKDSLSAVHNATQAAARIRQIFRNQSFQRKPFSELYGDELLNPDDKADSFVASKTSILGHSSDMDNAAAVNIQKKNHGWKKRKELLQDHFRGHQVRKKYEPILWSVGILEKVILRWRRKGSGLRGFQSDAVHKSRDMRADLPLEDDYDFLKEGRKQTEQRMEKTLSRVKSMDLHPEGRAQYHRLLTAAKGLREIKDAVPVNVEDIKLTEDITSLVEHLEDDTFMSLLFD